MRYRLGQFEAQVVPLKRQLEESMHRRIDTKETQLGALEEKLRLSDPKQRSREGWGEVTVEGRRKALEALEPGDEFELSDARVKLRARCLQKRPLP